MSLKIIPAVCSNLFDKVFLKLFALNKLFLFPMFVKKQCLFCVIVSTFDKLYSGWEWRVAYIQSLFVIHKICNLVVILQLTYQQTAKTYYFFTVEQKCCLSRSTLLNKKLLLCLVANKQSLHCKAKYN